MSFTVKINILDHATKYYQRITCYAITHVIVNKYSIFTNDMQFNI